MPRFSSIPFALMLVVPLLICGQQCLCAQVKDLPVKSPTEMRLEKFAYSDSAMGVPLNIVVYCERAKVESTIEAAVDAINQVNEVFSDYSDTSEVAKLNQAGGTWVEVSEEFALLLRDSQEIFQSTSGAFDITLGAMTHKWRQARKNKRLPESGDLKNALSVSGMARLQWDKTRRRIRFPKGMKFDFGGIGKGYAADLAMAALKKANAPIALVDLGGDIVVGDPPPSSVGWRVAIADRVPSNDQPIRKRFVQVKNCGIATSGDVEQFLEIDGMRYSHLLDPKTGVGLQRRANVTVIAKNGASADAFASAYSVLSMPEATEHCAKQAETHLLVQELENGKLSESKTEGFPRIRLSNEK